MLVLGAGLVVLRLQHSPAVPHTLRGLFHGLAATLEHGTLAEIARTSVGAFNWYSRQLPGWVYSAFWSAGALAGLGAVIALARHDPVLARHDPALARHDPALFARTPMILAIGALAFQLALIGLRGVAAGRYLAPAAPALGVLVALGVLGPLPPRWRSAGLVAVTAAFLALDGVFLFGGLLPHQYLVWGD